MNPIENVAMPPQRSDIAGRCPSRLGVGILLLASLLMLSCATDDTSPDPSGEALVGSSEEIYHSDDLEELMKHSVAVVEADVVDVVPGRSVGEGVEGVFQYREVTLKIVEVLDGSLDQQEIILEETGWADGKPIVFDGLQPSNIGDHGYYFITEKSTQPYYELTSSQGRYLKVGDSLTGADQSDPLIKSLERLSPAELEQQIESVAAQP